MLDQWLVVVGVLALLVSAVARRLDHWPVSVPLLALATGVVTGPRGLQLLEVPGGTDLALLETTARLLLAVAVMAVALRSSLQDMRALVVPVAWLLAVVLPGMALLGGLVAAVSLGMALPLALALGAALAPTDPVLASAVVGSDTARGLLPAPLRGLLSLESGANDGLALAFVIVAAAVVAPTTSPAASVLKSLWEIAGAVALGAGLGYLAGRVLRRAEQRRDVDPSRALTFTLVLSLTALGLGALIRTDGLLAVFVTGLAFNGATSGREREAEYNIDEALNRFLVLPFFVLLGLALPLGEWRDLGAGGVAFVLLLLLLRRLPLVLALRRPLRLSWPGAVWLGWFGPIGVAAVYYLTHLHRLGAVDPRVWHAGSLAVAASTVVHGMSASPSLPWFAHAMGRDPTEASQTGK